MEEYLNKNIDKVGPMDLHAIVEKIHRVPKKKIPTFESKKKQGKIDESDLMLDGYIRPNKYVKLQPLLKYEPEKSDENLTIEQNKKVQRKLCKM